jgi:hypothetical protein
MKAIKNGKGRLRTQGIRLTRALGVLIFAMIGCGVGRAQGTDSIVQIAADSQGLTQVAPADLPIIGATYWLVIPGGINGVSAVPLPCPPTDAAYPIFAITPDGQQFLVDETGGQVLPANSKIARTASSAMVTSAANVEVNTVIALINQVQETQAAQPMGRTMAMSVSMPPGFGDLGSGGGYTGGYNLYTFNTNLLWLQISNVLSGTAYASLFHGTDQVYSVWSTTNLLIPFSLWQVETEVFPTNSTTNCLPFTVSTLGRQDLFLRAQDWTGVELNGLPCWWTWLYFGNLSETATDLDSQGNTLGYDYTNGLDPNAISFTIVVANTYVNTAHPNLPLNIISGVPGYAAILVNDTNQADAVWQPLIGSIVVATLGADGDYNVSVGLRGLLSNTTESWQTVGLIKNTVFPRLTITNPVSGTLFQTPIQFQGFASEPLNTLTFDLSNAAGTFTNQQGYLTGQFYDPNLLAYTTNYFQSDDINLASGANTITLHATDWAGNQTNVSFTLNYSPNTNRPVLSFVWPQAGTPVLGSNFTLQAHVSDLTATVSATVNGNTTPGMVDTHGFVWAQNLSLNPGTNTVTLTANTALGGMTTTNFAVAMFNNNVGLTVDPVANDELNQNSITVTGTINDDLTTNSVYVNGVQAYPNNVAGGTDTWEADYVPVNAFGMATLSVQVSNSVRTAAENLNFPQPVTVAMMSYSGHQSFTFSGPPNYEDTINWFYQSGGSWSDNQESLLNITAATNGVGYVLDSNLPFIMPWEYASISADVTYYDRFYGTIYYATPFVSHTQTRVMIAPGGLSLPGTTNLYLVFARACEFSVTNFDNLSDGYGLTYYGLMQGKVENNINPALPYGGDIGLPPEWLQINGQTLVNTGLTNKLAASYGPSISSVWGATLVSAPAGKNWDVTPVATNVYQNWDYTFDVQAYQVGLKIFDANNGQDLTLQTNTVIVGQQMNLKCQLSIINSFMTNLVITNFQWTVPGYTLTNWYISGGPIYNFVVFSTNGYALPLAATNNQSVQFFWTDGATNTASASNLVVTCLATVGGVPVKGQATFNIVKPVVAVSAQTSALVLGTDKLKSYALCFGTNGGPPGILFTPTWTMPPGTNYNYGNTTSPGFEWLQIVTNLQNNYYFAVGGPPIITEFANESVLDGPDPYGYDRNYVWPINSDSPTAPVITGVYSGVSYSMGATMWLFFKPLNGQWVPIRTVTWGFSGSATNLGSGWFLTSSSWSTNPPDLNAGSSYPAWINNLSSWGIGTNNSD